MARGPLRRCQTRRAAAWCRGRCAFTLIELLVVVSIIAILAAMLLPALRKSLSQARSAACQGQERQIATAFSMYADEANDWYPTETGSTGFGWHRERLPSLNSSMAVLLCPTTQANNFYTGASQYEYNSYGTSQSIVGTGNVAKAKRQEYLFPEQTCLVLDAHHYNFNQYQCLGMPGVQINPFPITNVVEWRHDNRLNVLYMGGQVATREFDLPQSVWDVFYRRWPNAPQP